QPPRIPGHASALRRSPDRVGRQPAALDEVRDQAAKDVTMERRLPIAREGWPFILGSAAIAVGLRLTGHRRLALPFWAASLASLGFFRAPERDIPAVANGGLAPADGRGLGVEDAVDPFVGPSTRVSIFLSPLDVHVNR